MAVERKYRDLERQIMWILDVLAGGHFYGYSAKFNNESVPNIGKIEWRIMFDKDKLACNAGGGSRIIELLNNAGIEASAETTQHGNYLKIPVTESMPNQLDDLMRTHREAIITLARDFHHVVHSRLYGSDLEPLELITLQIPKLSDGSALDVVQAAEVIRGHERDVLSLKGQLGLPERPTIYARVQAGNLAGRA